MIRHKRFETEAAIDNARRKSTCDQLAAQGCDDRYVLRELRDVSKPRTKPVNHS